MSNKVLKISDLSIILDDTIDYLDLNYFWLKGEIQNYRNTNKHLYFSLSEKEYSIKAIIWKSIYDELGIELSNGLKGEFYGKINYYKNKNEISFVIYKVKLDNDIGDIYQKLENYKNICKKRGYFDKTKKNVTSLNNIALITRYDSAAYNDLVDMIQKCYGIKLYVYDSGMQGINSKEQIVTGINLFNKLQKKLKLDSLIITRGGGSKEDLWVFNELDIVEACYNSKIPIITGIGHEIDVSLVDLIADKHCITPTDIGRFIIDNNSIRSKLEYLDLVKNDLILKLKMGYNLKKDKINKVLDQIDNDKIIERLEDKKRNLCKYKTLLEKKLRDFSMSRLSKLNYIKNDTYNIVNSILDIKLYDKKTLIFDSSALVAGNTYKLKFNNKTFKIKIIK